MLKKKTVYRYCVTSGKALRYDKSAEWKVEFLSITIILLSFSLQLSVFHVLQRKKWLYFNSLFLLLIIDQVFSMTSNIKVTVYSDLA